MGERFNRFVAAAGLAASLETAAVPNAEAAEPKKNKVEHVQKQKNVYDGPALINVNADKEYTARHKKYQQSEDPKMAELEDITLTEKSNGRELELFVQEIKKAYPEKKGQTIINELFTKLGAFKGPDDRLKISIDPFEAKWHLETYIKYYKIAPESNK